MTFDVTPGQHPGAYRIQVQGLTFEATAFVRRTPHHEAEVSIYRGDAVVHRDRVDLARAEARGAFIERMRTRAAFDGVVSAEDLERLLLAFGEADRRAPGKPKHEPGGGLPLEFVIPDGVPADLIDVVRDLRLPGGYRLEGGELLGDAGRTITTTPVLPVFEVDDVDLRARLFGCLILVRGQWRLEVLLRGELFDRKKIITRLAGLGVDIASGSESALITFLQTYVRANRDLLPLRRRTARLGFHRVDNHVVCLLRRAWPSDSKLTFDPGEDEEARARHAALEPRGTFAGWVAWVERILQYPIPCFILLMALVGALRELLGLPLKSCIVHLVARSTTGKSAVQQLGCSVWAQPGPDWIRSAYATYAGLEKLLMPTLGLPLFLEDTHQIAPEIRSLLAFAVGNEAFKARGGDRRRPQLHWRGVVISSDEFSFLHGASATGEGARVVTVRGLPFLQQSPERKQFVEEFRAGVHAHSGHLGPAVLEKLTTLTPDAQAALVREWEQLERAYGASAGRHPLLARQAGLYAAAELAAKLVAELTGLSRMKLTAAINSVFDQAKLEATPSPARLGYELLAAEIASQREACVRWDDEDRKYKTQLGARQVGVINETDGWAAIFPNRGREALRRAGLQPDDVLEAMRENKLLDADARHFTKLVYYLGRRDRMFVLPWPQRDDDSDPDEA